MVLQTPIRFRSDLIVKRAGRFHFDGYVGTEWKSQPRPDETVVDLAIGDAYPRLSHACWWLRAAEPPLESAAEQRMSWEGGPAAPRKGEQS